MCMCICMCMRMCMCSYPVRTYILTYYERLELGLLHVEELLDEPAPLIGRPPLLGVQDRSIGDVKPQPPCWLSG